MQQRCPVQNCGRMFQNQLTMLEHVKRRHPQLSDKIKLQTTNQMLDKQNRITQEINKLPKMQKVIQMSKQKKPLEFHRRSNSKKRIELSNIIENNHNKINSIITDSRQLLNQNTNSRKLLKRPSLSNKTSDQQDTKLPSLKQSNIKKIKLDSIKSQLNSSTMTRQTNIQRQKLSANNQSIQQGQSQTVMYSTAPNFTHQMNKKIQLIRSRTKKDGELSNRSSSKDIKEGKAQTGPILSKKRLSSQTSQTLSQSEKGLDLSTKPVFRPSVKKLLERSKKDTTQSILATSQDLTHSTFVQKSQLAQSKKQLIFQPKKRPLSKQGQRFSKKQGSQVGSSIVESQSKYCLQLSEQLNWQQRTVTIRNKSIKNLVIPQFAKVQYLYASGCGIENVDLNQCYSLITLTLTHNQVFSLDFLQLTLNGAYQNLQELYLDHNLLISLESLPTYLQLKKLSLTFNKISGLDQVIKVLVKLTTLQQLDLSFNPVRKQPNYKLAVLAGCKQLKKLDGMLVTKFDRQMSAEYHKMYFDYLHIIPLSCSPMSEDKFRPSTAVSFNYQHQLDPQNPINEMSEQQLTSQIEILQKMIKNTKDQFQMIQQQNNALEQQIESYEINLENMQRNQQEFNPKVYKKLCKQVEELQMLNFLQYASQKQLEEIIYKKLNQKGLSPQLLTAI